MKIHQLSLCGITEAFPGPVSVDFEALGPGLIALVGQNGAGKSTLIGSVFAALFRQLPGQKRSLYDFATHPQPGIDLTFSVNGACYRSLLKIDPKSRQMESYLFNGEGKPLTNGKKEPFEELVRMSSLRRWVEMPGTAGRAASYVSVTFTTVYECAGNWNVMREPTGGASSAPGTTRFEASNPLTALRSEPVSTKQVLTRVGVASRQITCRSRGFSKSRFRMNRVAVLLSESIVPLTSR